MIARMDIHATSEQIPCSGDQGIDPLLISNLGPYQARIGTGSLQEWQKSLQISLQRAKLVSMRGICWQIGERQGEGKSATPTGVGRDASTP